MSDSRIGISQNSKFSEFELIEHQGQVLIGFMHTGGEKPKIFYPLMATSSGGQDLVAQAKGKREDLYQLGQKVMDLVNKMGLAEKDNLSFTTITKEGEGEQAVFTASRTLPNQQEKEIFTRVDNTRKNTLEEIAKIFGEIGHLCPTSRSFSQSVSHSRAPHAIDSPSKNPHEKNLKTEALPISSRKESDKKGGHEEEISSLQPIAPKPEESPSPHVKRSNTRKDKNAALSEETAVTTHSEIVSHTSTSSSSLDRTADRKQLTPEGLASKDVTASPKPSSVQAASATRAIQNSSSVTIQHAGYRNGGNTCYLASALQAIRLTPSYRQVFTRELPQKEILRGSPPKFLEVSNYSGRVELQALIRDSFTKLDAGTTVSEDEINQIRSKMISLNLLEQSDSLAQLDASEYLGKLLDCMIANTVVDEISGEYKVSPLISPIHHRIYSTQSELSCTIDREEIDWTDGSTQSRYSLDLQLDTSFPTIAKKGQSIQTVLERSLGDVEPDDDFVVDAENFKTRSKNATFPERSATKSERGEGHITVRQTRGEEVQERQIGPYHQQYTLQALPPTLSLTLKRYTYDPQGGIQRVRGAIELNESIDVKNVLHQSVSAEERAKGTRYKIKNIIVHQGSSPESGHYYMYTRVGDGDTFICLNDGRVRKPQTLDLKRIENAYMVTYERIETDRETIPNTEIGHGEGVQEEEEGKERTHLRRRMWTKKRKSPHSTVASRYLEKPASGHMSTESKSSSKPKKLGDRVHLLPSSNAEQANRSKRTKQERKGTIGELFDSTLLAGANILSLFS